MDIRLHLGILRRWRALLVLGVLFGTLVAVLVTFKVSPTGLEWRSEATFTSTSRTIVTQPGFPWGRATLPGSDPTQPVVTGGDRPRTFAPPARFSELAVVYSYLAQSEQVRRLIRPEPLEDQILVTSIKNPATNEPLPLLEIATMASSSGGARALNGAVIEALGDYLQRGVRANAVPSDERVQLEVLNPPSAGALIGGRSITLSVIIFLLVIAAAVVGAYVLENLYPSVAPAALRRNGLEPLEPTPTLDDMAYLGTRRGVLFEPDGDEPSASGAAREPAA